VSPKIYSNTKASRVLNGKGFRERKGRHNHRIFELVVDGVITRIRTKFSHTRKGNIAGSLKRKIAKQLKMNNGNKLTEFLDCTYTLPQYLDDLRENGHLP